MLRLEKHPDKTFIGRIERGFDFPGYHFSPAGLTVAKEARFVARATRLYEQEPGEADASARLGLSCNDGSGGLARGSAGMTARSDGNCVRRRRAMVRYRRTTSTSRPGRAKQQTATP